MHVNASIWQLKASKWERFNAFLLLNFWFFILYTASLLYDDDDDDGMLIEKSKIHMMPYLNVISNDSFSVILPLARRHFHSSHIELNLCTYTHTLVSPRVSCFVQ